MFVNTLRAAELKSHEIRKFEIKEEAVALEQEKEWISFREANKNPRREMTPQSKFQGTQLYETPDMDELVNLQPKFKRSDDIIADLAVRCAKRGFRLYRHSTGT